MCAFESDRNFLNLAARLFRTEVNSRADRHRAHVKCLLDAGVQSLIILGWGSLGFRCGSV